MVGDTVSGRNLRRTAIYVETWHEFEVEVREGKRSLEKRAFEWLWDIGGHRSNELTILARIVGKHEHYVKPDRDDAGPAGRTEQEFGE